MITKTETQLTIPFQTGNNQPPWRCNFTNSITYESGPQYSGRHARWKQCTHVGIHASTGAVRTVVNAGWSGVLDLVTHFPKNPQGFGGELMSISRSDLPSLLSEAKDVLKGRIQSRALPFTDLVQFMFMRKAAKQVVLSLSSIGSYWKKNKQWCFLDLLRKAANADLAFKFGIKPLYDTFVQVMSAGQRVDAHLEELKRRNAGLQNNYKATITTVSRKSESKGRCSVWSGSSVALDYTTHYSIYGGGTVHFKARADYSTCDSVRTSLLWDAAGFHSFFSTAWDLIPLSFIVDYFVRIDRFLEQLDEYYFHTAPVERIETITDAWVTQTAKVEESYSCESYVADSPSRVQAFEPGSLGKISAIRFDRYRLPTSNYLDAVEGLSTPNLGTPTISQALSGLEVGVQRFI